MMKSDYEVHEGTLGLIQPNDIPWDCGPMGFQIPQVSLAQPVSLHSGNYTGSDFSEFMDHVARHISNMSPDSTIDELSVDNSTTSIDKNFPPPVAYTEYYRPHKAAKRTYMSDISTKIVLEHTKAATTNPSNEKEEQALSMITILLECAVAISVDNLSDANRMLLELTQLASPYSPSCAERVVAYFANAMLSRVMSSWLANCLPLVQHKSILASFQAFNNISPFIKFSHFTANQAILEAFHMHDRVHIVDLDIMQGLQWPALFHILAIRPDGPPHVRMTGLGASMQALQETGKQLSNFAKRLGMSFEFNPIAKRFGDLDPLALQTRRGEAVAVHWLKHSLYDANGPDWATIKLIEAIRPNVITLVEQEMIHTGSFLDQFVGSLHYYSTLFDSLGASLPVDDSARYLVENGLLAREIRNILAIGAPTRNGEEKFANWRIELSRRPNFMQLPMSSNAMAQAQLILNMFPPSLGYTILQGDGTLRLGWKDTALYTASAWTSRIGR